MRYGKFTPVFFDIETTRTTDQETITAVGASVRPPAQMSKPETIAKWEKEKKPGAIAKALDATALNGSYGRVGAIGIDCGKRSLLTFKGRGEADLLEEFGERLEGIWEGKENPRLVGFNILGFDIPFLRKRYAINNLVVPAALRVDCRPWSLEVCDVMVRWDPQKYIKQDELARILGLKVQPSCPSSEIPKKILNGEWADVEEHLDADLDNLLAIFTSLGVSGFLDTE